MKARVIVYDDNDKPVGSYYELEPSRIYKSKFSTKYIFKFEYNQFNYGVNDQEDNNS